jgi:hypothetical protein
MQHFNRQLSSEANAGADGKKESLADTTNTGLYKRWGFDGAGEGLRFIPRNECDGISGIGQEKETILADTKGTQFEGNKRTERIGAKHADIGSSSWWQAEPNVDRVADGLASRVDRLKAIGNGQVPLCAATAWRILNA